MSEWSVLDGRYPSCSCQPCPYVPVPVPGPQPAQYSPTQAHPSPPTAMEHCPSANPKPPQPKRAPKMDNPREIRNRAEKQRRDIMNQSVSRLASIVPPVAMAGKKVDKTSVLRLTAHYLRAHKHVFGKSVNRGPRFSRDFTRSFLKTMKGFIITTTYKGLVVVVSPNIQEYLGYTELELLGQNLYSIVHPEDHMLLREQLFPRCCKLTSNGELLLSKEPDAGHKVAEALKHEKRAFIIRFKKLTHLRTEPVKYLTCHVEGSFRKSDDAGVYVDNNVQIGRRVRSRGNNPYASGNDIVFVAMIHPITETFATESRIESFRMEYRTRHSIDGSILQCEQRISLITGYMIHEVSGVNAMNFMHRDDVRWVVFALRDMYVNHRLMGESCYRLMTKNGQFIHMRTRGALEVDPSSKEATSFVCTNTMVPEEEGLELIQQMKKKFSLKINNEKQKDEDITENSEDPENYPPLPVEDPRHLEQVIYHLVTDLPSPLPEEKASKKSEDSNADLSIIPPKKEQIKKAIEKSYTVIKTLRHSEPKNLTDNHMHEDQSPSGSAQKSPNADSSISETSLEPMDQQHFTPVIQNNIGCKPTNVENEYSWIAAPLSPSYNPSSHSSHQEQSLNHYEHTSHEYNNSVAHCSRDPDPGYEYGPSTSQTVFDSFDFQTEMTEYNKSSVQDNSVKMESTEFLECRLSTKKLQLNVSKKPESGYNNENLKDDNYLASPASFNDNFDIKPDDTEIGRNLWTSAQPLFGQFLESSASAFMQTNNISYLGTDINVATNLPDFELSPEMDCIITGTFLDEERLLEEAEQASRALNETAIEDVVRAAEIEQFEMDSQFPDVREEMEGFLFENTLIVTLLTQTKEVEITTNNTTEQNDPQTNPVEPNASNVNNFNDNVPFESKADGE